MAAAKDLPIYRTAMRLLVHLTETTRKAPRDLRHTLVQRMIDEATDIPVAVALANWIKGPERAAEVKALRVRVVRVQVLVAIANELKCFASAGSAAVAMEHADALGRQAHGWERHTIGEPAAATRQSRTDPRDRAGEHR